MSIDTKDLKEEFDRKKWREEREAQLRRIMTPINANRGIRNCGHVALRLNQYLSNLSTLSLKSDSELHIEPVPTTNANQRFQFDCGYLMGMEANNDDILRCCVFVASRFKEIVDLTKDKSDDLTLDLDSSKETTEKLKFNRASYKNIADALSQLTRSPDDRRIYGFLITGRTIEGQMQGHISNFLVDEHDEVYFLDAQTDPVYIGKTPLPGFDDDLFYVASLAKSRMHLDHNSTILPKIKKELLEGEGVVNLLELNLNDIQIYELYQVKITKRTLSTAEFGYIAKLALSEQPCAEMNNLGAQALYGYCSQVGLHVDQDETRAAAFYKKAAEHHYAPAQTCFGFCYVRGIGIARDLKLGFEWFEKAAQQNYAPAQYNLGIFYGVEANLKLAVEWLEKAAQQNHVRAVEALERLKNALHIEQPNEKLKKEVESENKLLKDQNEQLREQVSMLNKQLSNSQEHNKLLQSQIKRQGEKRSFSEMANDNTAAAATPTIATVTGATTSNSTVTTGSSLKRARH